MRNNAGVLANQISQLDLTYIININKVSLFPLVTNNLTGENDRVIWSTVHLPQIYPHKRSILFSAESKHIKQGTGSNLSIYGHQVCLVT